MRKKKGPSKKAFVEAVGKMAAKSKELDWSQGRPADEAQKALDEPKFVYVKLDRVWGPWKRGQDGNNGGFILTWGVEKVGFGEMSFAMQRDGRITCDTECMGGQSWAQAVLTEFLKTAVVYDPESKK